jgi:hypothetical protein
MAQIRVPGLHLVHGLQILLYLNELLTLLVLDIFLVAHRHEEIVLERRNLQILQQDSLTILFELGQKLCNLLLVNACRSIVKEWAFDNLASCLKSYVK